LNNIDNLMNLLNRQFNRADKPILIGDWNNAALQIQFKSVTSSKSSLSWVRMMQPWETKHELWQYLQAKWRSKSTDASRICWRSRRDLLLLLLRLVAGAERSLYFDCVWACLDTPKNSKLYKVPHHIESYGTYMEH